MKFMKRVLTLLTILCCLLGAGLPDAQLAVAEVTNATKADKMALGQGSAFEVGGYGTSLGQFKQLRDITFDRANRLRTLEGRYAVDSSINASDTTTVAGNLRIQKFDAAGNAVSQISLADASLGIHNEPKRLAALDDDTLFVTIPRAGVVKRIAPNGSFLPNIPIPRAFAITRVLFAGSSQERIAVVGNGKSGITNGTLVPETQIHIINPDTGSVVPISLTRNGAPFSLTNALDMAADSQGYFYILAAVNRIYKFSPAGVFLRFIGSGTNGGLVNAGSEFLHTVTVDADGNIYTMSWGNPGLVTQFNSDVTIMRTRPAQYEYAKSWSSHSGYTPLQFDRAGRLWAGVTKEESTTPVLGRYPVWCAPPRTCSTLMCRALAPCSAAHC
jgi:hypothetical protein